MPLDKALIQLIAHWLYQKMKHKGLIL